MKYKGFDRKKEISDLLRITRKQFPNPPSFDYIEEVANYIDNLRTFSMKNIIEFLTELPNNHKTFPPLSILKEEIVKYSKKSRIKASADYQKPKEIYWHDRKVPGTPPVADSLFCMMKKGDMTSRGFNFARRILLKTLSEKEIMNAFELWTEGKVHEKFKEVSAPPETNPLNSQLENDGDIFS